MAIANRIRIHDHLAELFEAPRWLDDEARKAYGALLSELEKEIEPQTILDKIRLSELVNKYFEEQRFKGTLAALIETASVPSLAMLLGPRYGDNLEQAMSVAQDYFSGIPERMRFAKKIMQEMKINEAHILANAMYIRATGVQAIERMISNREISRTALTNECERRSKKAIKSSG